jgi:hypothetical protein
MSKAEQGKADQIDWIHRFTVMANLILEYLILKVPDTTRPAP